MIKKKDKEFLNGLMVEDMMENGKMVNSMGLVITMIQMEIKKLESGKMARE